MGLWPFGKAKADVEAASRVVVLRARDGLPMRGKVTVKLAEPQTQAAADELVEACADLMRALVREAPDAPSVLGFETAVAAEVMARLPKQPAILRTVEVVGIHIVGDPGHLAQPSASSGQPPAWLQAAPPSTPLSSDIRPTGRPPPPSVAPAPPKPMAPAPADLAPTPVAPVVASDPFASTAISPSPFAQRPSAFAATALAPASVDTSLAKAGASAPADLSSPARGRPISTLPPPSASRHPSSPPDRVALVPAPRAAGLTPGRGTPIQNPRFTSSVPPAPLRPPSVPGMPAVSPRPPSVPRMPAVSPSPADEPSASRRISALPSSRASALPSSRGSSVHGPPSSLTGPASRPALQRLPPAAVAARRRAVGARLFFPLGAGPYEVARGLTPLLRDTAGRVLVAFLRTYDLTLVRRVPLDAVESDILSSLTAPSDGAPGTYAASHAGEIARWREALGPAKMEQLQREANLAAAALAYAGLTTEGVPQSMANAVLEGLAGAAFGDPDMIIELGRYLFPAHETTSAEALSNMIDITGESMPAGMEAALDPLFVSLGEEIAAAAQIARDVMLNVQ